MQTKEQRAAYYKKYYAVNREKRLARAKTYREAHPEKTSAQQKAWRAANREKVLAYHKAYAADHPNECLARDHKRRAKKAGVKTVNPKAILAWLNGWKTEAAVACHYCRVIFPGKSMTMDHVIPISAGGDHDLNNLVVCCEFCNKSKHDKLLEEWQN